MKRTIVFVLLLFMLILSACGTSSGGSRSTYSEPPTSTTSGNYGDLYPSANTSQRSEESALRSPEDGVLIYDDEYVTIYYLGCEQRREREMVFYAVNKTDVTLSFQANSLAINGESLGYVSGSDSIAPESKGKFRFDTEEEFPTMNPDTISGEIHVIDFSRTLLERSINISFANVDVSN